MKPEFEKLYEHAMEAFNNRDYENAERHFQQILNINANFADIQNSMGIVYNQTNRLEHAVKAFERALELNPGYTEASLNLAITYGDLGMYEKSREVFERAARFSHTEKKAIDPFVRGKLANEHLGVGKIYQQLGLFDEAIDEYRKALRLSPAFADILTQLGIALRDKGQHDEAIKEFNKAKEVNPQYIPARLHLGITYYSRGFYGLAEEEWRDALTIDPKNSALKTYLNFVKPRNP
ncbi:MAG: tetratricopeptide repeat protein [Nitrospirota bacterium]